MVSAFRSIRICRRPTKTTNLTQALLERSRKIVNRIKVSEKTGYMRSKLRNDQNAIWVNVVTHSLYCFGLFLPTHYLRWQTTNFSKKRWHYFMFGDKVAEFRLLYLLRFLKHTFMEIYTLLRIKILINVNIQPLNIWIPT